MLKSIITTLAVATVTAFSFPALAQDTPATAPAPKADAATVPVPEVKPAPKGKQADVASTNASFGKIAKTDDAYKSAFDAHSLDDALKMVDKEGAFKGTVAKVFEPRGLAIVEFDADYKTALTAIVRGTNFANFPVLTNLIGKDVLVTGKFIKFRESAEIVLDQPDQIKVAQ